MKFEIYQAPFEQTALGYSPGAAYKRVWEQEVGDVSWNEAPVFFATGPDATPVLERIWRDFQRVDPETGPWPPEGYTGRSLSIGDVIVLDGWAPFAVESAGFSVARDFEGLVPGGENVWVPREDGLEA